MSIPRNHHYVSRCQIENFFNHEEGRIYLYDKELDNFFHKETTKSVFSEKDSNSKVTDGEIDHLSVELELKSSFEDGFTPSYKELMKTLQDANGIVSFPEHLLKLLIQFTKYGLAGEIRSPKIKTFADEAINEALLEQILPFAAPDLKKELEELKALLSKTKHSNQISYNWFAESALQMMGEVYFEIYYIIDDCVFVLPDKPSLTQRERINQYYNPDIWEIAIVDVPLSSKIFLHAVSTKLEKGTNRIIRLSKDNKNFIDAVNTSILQYSFKQVACESSKYLEEIVNNWRSNK